MTELKTQRSKDAFALYLMGGLKVHAALLRQLGAHKVGGGCLYIRRLADIERAVLSRLIATTYAINTAGTRPAAGAKATSSPPASVR